MSLPSTGGVSPVAPTVIPTGGVSVVAPAQPSVSGVSSAGAGTASTSAAYQEGLAFEQVLMNELTQQLTQTITNGSGGDSGDGSGDDGSGDSSTDSSTGLLGSDAASSMYAQLLPSALTQSIMSAGGLGIASELAPALGATTASTQLGTTPPTKK